jgi:cytochrome c5
MRFVVVILLLGVSFSNFAGSDNTKQQIEQRIQPIGKVHVQEEQKEQVKNNELPLNKEEPGQRTYERFCIVCHRDGLVGAPKFRDEQAWKSRLAGRTLNELVTSALKGLNAMPAKGTCYECTEEDIKSAIEYMLRKS